MHVICSKVTSITQDRANNLTPAADKQASFHVVSQRDFFFFLDPPKWRVSGSECMPGRRDGDCTREGDHDVSVQAQRTWFWEEAIGRPRSYDDAG
mmetsp:Transcript_20941/g.49397  ORF Transcript_20941/g.49397 Transcript_20941/m.49397 type:complete len:95 (-) Transcript_20941:4047-4331(-)